MQGVPLRRRLFLLVAAALLPLAAMAGFAVFAVLQQQRAQAERAGLEITRALAIAIDGELQRSAAVLGTLASSPLIDAGDLNAYSRLVRIALANVRKRIHRLRVGGQHVPDSDAQLRSAATKADRRLAAAKEAETAIARKAQQQEAVRIQQQVLNRKLIEKLSYLHHFHAAAHALLPEEQCRAVSAAAAEGVRQAAAEILAVPA